MLSKIFGGLVLLLGLNFWWLLFSTGYTNIPANITWGLLLSGIGAWLLLKSPPLSRLSYWYLIPPVLTFLLVIPVISDFPPFKRVDSPNIFQLMIVLPFYLGLMAAPGYAYAWAEYFNRAGMPEKQQRWVRISLATAVVSSLWGAIISIPAVIPAPFAFWSFVMAMILWRRFKRS